MANPWVIQVLTPDFLFDGKIDPGGDYFNPYIFESVTSTSQPCTAVVNLTSARVQPVNNLTAPIEPATNWFISGANAFVVAIPRDEASTSYLVKHNRYKSLIPGDVYVGPYCISGKVWSPDRPELGLGFLCFYARFVMQDIRINGLLPGSTLHGLEAPFAVVRTHLLQCATVRA
jgi:hypothetical protein